MKDFLEFYELFLVWPVAFLGVVALVATDTIRGRILAGIFLVALFTPFIHRSIGNWYFEYLCKHEAGEFIHRTVQGVEGVLQMRPRDGSRDYFDRMVDRDFPEDPWGHTNSDANSPWTMLRSFRFVETRSTVFPSKYARDLYDESMYRTPTNEERFAVFSRNDGQSLKSIRKEFSDSPRSLHGYTWNDVTTFGQGWFGIRAGEILVVELKSNEVLARKAGFMRLRSLSFCPAKQEEHVENFVASVLVSNQVTNRPVGQ